MINREYKTKNVANCRPDGTTECYFMDFHEDEWYLDEDGCYTISILEVDQPCAIIHYDHDDRMIMTECFAGLSLNFVASKEHALLPLELAKRLYDGWIGKEDIYAMYPLFHGYYLKPVLIFRFED